AIVRLKQENSIKVKGTAGRTITSDSATWRSQFAVRSANLKDGYSALEESRKVVKQFLTEANVPEVECTYSAILTDLEYKKDDNGRPTNAIEFYLLSQTVEVKSKDVKRVDTISTTVTELIKSGVEI